MNMRVEPRQLDDRPPISNQRKKNNQYISAHIHVPAFVDCKNIQGYAPLVENPILRLKSGVGSRPCGTFSIGRWQANWGGGKPITQLVAPWAWGRLYCAPKPKSTSGYTSRFRAFVSNPSHWPSGSCRHTTLTVQVPK